MKIKFWNVGPGKWTGTVRVKDGVDLELAVIREAKKHLRSKGVDIDPPDGAAPGMILVGGFRTVGYFKYET